MSTKPTEEAIMAALKAQTSHAFYLEHPQIINSRPDLVGISIDPSLEIHGYEIKRSRQDWLAERRRGKNGSSRDACDYWWIVGLPDVIKMEDLGPGWGLKILMPEGTFENYQLASESSSGPIDRWFARSVFSKIVESTPKTKWTDSAYADGYRDAMKELLGYSFHRNHSPKHVRALLGALDSRASFKELTTLVDLQSKMSHIQRHIDRIVEGLPSYKDWETGEALPPELEAMKPEIERELIKKWPGLQSNPNFNGIVEYTAKSRYVGL